MRGGIKSKQKETLNEPKRLTKLGLGFDLDIDHKIKYTHSHTKTPKRKPRLNWFWRKLMHMKIYLNPVAL